MDAKQHVPCMDKDGNDDVAWDAHYVAGYVDEDEKSPDRTRKDQSSPRPAAPYPHAELGCLRPPSKVPPPFFLRQGILARSHETFMLMRSAEQRLTGAIKLLSDSMTDLRATLEQGLPGVQREGGGGTNSTAADLSPAYAPFSHMPQRWLEYGSTAVASAYEHDVRDRLGALRHFGPYYAAIERSREADYTAKCKEASERRAKKQTSTTVPEAGAPLASQPPQESDRASTSVGLPLSKQKAVVPSSTTMAGGDASSAATLPKGAPKTLKKAAPIVSKGKGKPSLLKATPKKALTS